MEATASKQAVVPQQQSPELAALTALASLKDGEQFAGIVRDESGRWSIVVLLPGDADELTWKAALAWAKEQGGELPTRREQSLLFANLKDAFEGDWYWSGEQCAPYPDYAWIQTFDDGDQGYGHKGDRYRARAVRRLVIQ